MTRSTVRIPRPLVAALAVFALMIPAARPVSAGGGLEIIPAIGVSGGNSGGTATYYALDGRLPLFPTFMIDAGVAFRSDDYQNDVKAKQWTVTGSLLWMPMPMLYAGAGIGSYSTDFTQPINSNYDSNDTKFATHLTAGFRMPIVPKVVTLDINGRYVFLGNKAPTATDGSLNADFWLVAAGVAVGF
ncbi:MAG: outer membrane protein [Candidatus Eisenbacteria bacterium]